MRGIFESKSKLFIILQSIFLLVVLASSFFEDYLGGRDIFLFSAFAITLLWLIFFWKKRNTRVILLMILFLLLGLWRFSFSIHDIGKNEIASLNETKQTVEGIIKNNPETSQKNQQFVLEVERATGKEYLGRLLVFANIYPRLSYGDKLSIDCKLNTPVPIEDFAYNKYLAMKNIYSICYYPKIKTLSTDEANGILSFVYSLKNKFRDSINKNLGEPSAGIVNAMILGDKKFLSGDLQLKFSKAGISHIIAISGMHIGVFVVGLGFLFFFFGFSRNISFYLILFFLIFYNIMIGFPSSALRASVMGILILYAFKIGRLNKIYNSIIFVASVLVIVNPMLIRYDLGFIFSFSALLGIVYFYPIINSNFKSIDNRILKYSRDIIIVSISAQLFILPLIVKNFGILSLISPLVNLFVIWALPFILIFAVVAFLLSLIFSSLSFYLFLPLKFLLAYVFITVDTSLNIPFSSFELKDISNYYFVFYYLAIFIFVIYRNTTKKKENFTNKL